MLEWSFSDLPCDGDCGFLRHGKLPNRGEKTEPSKRVDSAHFKGNQQRDGRGHTNWRQEVSNWNVQVARAGARAPNCQSRAAPAA
jgi:hypothetical protein